MKFSLKDMAHRYWTERKIMDDCKAKDYEWFFCSAAILTGNISARNIMTLCRKTHYDFDILEDAILSNKLNKSQEQKLIDKQIQKNLVHRVRLETSR